MMDRISVKNDFRQSESIGILYCILESAVQLICGLCISGGLEFALQSRWRDVWRILPVTGILLAAGMFFLFYFAKLRNKKKAEDQFIWKQSIRRGMLDGQIKIGRSGELEVKLSKDAACISGYYQDVLPRAVSSSLIMAVCLIFLCVINRKIGILFLLMNFLQIIPTVLYEKYTKAIYETTHENEEDYEEWILEGYHGLKTLKSYRQEGWFLKRYKAMQKNMIACGMRAEKTATMESIVFEAIAALLNYGSYVILGLFVLAGETDMAQTPVLLILARNLFRTMLPVFDLRIKNFEYQSACRRLGILESQKEMSALTGETAAVLTVRNLSKTYEGKTVISNLSFQVKQKEKVLLKGKNGSGKTTLILLLLGFEKAEKGEICYGMDRETFDYCLQEEPDWNDTGYVLAREMEQAKSLQGGRFREYLKGFGITDEIMSKSLNQLSSGEKKKFFLAAAFAGKGDVLLLDEPSNHLDQKSREYLSILIESYPGTLIVCSHDEKLFDGWQQVIRMKQCSDETNSVQKKQYLNETGGSI